MSLSLIPLLAACSQTATKGDSIKPPKGITPPVVTQISESGQNRRPRFRDNNEVIFVSGDRLNHKHWQAYSKKIGGSAEKRLTFQEADIYDIQWVSRRKKFLYSSAMDEIVEELPSVKTKVLPPFKEDHKINFVTRPATELYLADDLGEDIDRLTRSQNFDGDADMHPKKNEMVFVSLRTGSPRIYEQSGDDKARRITKDDATESHPRYSPDGRSIVWVKQTSDKSSEILLKTGNKITTLVAGDDWNLDPDWLPSGDEILFSSNREDSNFEIYVVKKDGTCLRRLTYHSATDREPSASPDGGRIAFTSYRGGEWHIHVMNGTLPPCASKEP